MLSLIGALQACWVVLQIIGSAILIAIGPGDWKSYRIASPSSFPTLRIGDRILVDRSAYQTRPPQRGDTVVFVPPPRASDHPEQSWVKRVIGIEGDRIAVRGDHLFLNGRAAAEPYVSLLGWGSDQPGKTPVSSGVYRYRFPDPDLLCLPNLPPGARGYVYARGTGAIFENLGYHYEFRRTRDAAPRTGEDYLFFLKNAPVEGLEAVVPPGQLFLMGDNRNDSIDSDDFGTVPYSTVVGKVRYVFWPPLRIRAF